MRQRTLPDLLAPGLDIVSIGINPSVYSVERGFYFARPGNRFWPALNASGLLPAQLTPSRDSVERLFREHRIGFTDLVKRATPRAADLAEDDYRQGARTLQRKLARYAPAIAWFHGVSGYRLFLAHAGMLRPTIAVGLQPERIGTTRIFVTPNPSGANPRANPKQIVPLYRELARLRDELTSI
ncbi:MAG TPA: mismatch-specific DNA-glycosylase [Methylomirabilota bacterium]|nr:mismatch-specific DNA-glycosylase [Methylomirabilota bacterium]